MCGIVGGIGENIYDYISSNITLLKNRGPDSFGIIKADTHLTLGATRLAMVDPHPRSNQPMEDPITGNIILFNGEIYNFASIKKYLVAQGIAFNTKSDTEVALKALAFNSEMFIKVFEGMFAFALYEKKNNSLLLGRDYLGKKPLYYSFGPNYFIFSSQINVVKGYIKNLTLDSNSISTYLKLGYVVSPNTMYSEIKSVMPGETLKIDLKTQMIYSNSTFTPNKLIDPNNNSIQAILNNSILDRVSGHNKFAISLSGGIDSSLIALSSKKLGLNFEAYTMRWRDSDKLSYNLDYSAAEQIAKNLKIDFNVVDMPNTSKIPDLLTDYINALGEPNSNPSGLSMMALYSQISSDGHRLVLTGDGSDELFAGYKRYNAIKKIKHIPHLHSRLLDDFYKSKFTQNAFLKKAFLAVTSEKSLNFWLSWQELANDFYLRKFYNLYVTQEFRHLNDNFLSIVDSHNDKIASTMVRDLKIWLEMESNVKLDRISMYHSIEARSPFQDEKLVGTAYAVMLKNNFKLINKKLLTEAFPDLQTLPINENKHGFLSPLGHWLRNNNDLVQDSISYIKNNFDFNNDELKRLVKSPDLRMYSEFRFLWSLIVLAKWHDLQ